MLNLEQIKNFFPLSLRENPIYSKYLLKEYLQLLILDYLATTPYIRKITFIGGTYLHLIKGIDRFSEDLDFDCKQMSIQEFIEMTDSILQFLLKFGLKTETRDKANDKLKAFRRNFYFPELLFDLGLSGYKEERFLIKVECQDQQIDYKREMINVKGCGLFFPFPAPTDGVLCGMKISALLSRQKGRDFYDVMFLMGQTTPDYSFLSLKCGIHNLPELKTAVSDILAKIDLKNKTKDFEHLLFNKVSSQRILSFGEFIEQIN
ncbi:MAG: nucleotidyl transferase AbiEii/AbiGii toxin family protein [Bacteroidia bacterium]|nr:nucleotidyl transferase AbiEii/AbiGii toxin family protein [Bacteroidia bacterium]